MPPDAIRISWEHNRGLALPVRLAHAAWRLWAPVHQWAAAPARRAWGLSLVYGLLAVAALWPLDAWAASLVTAGGTRGSLPIGGDIRRELEALQQFGQGGMTVVVALAIWLGDPERRRRLLDWLVAVGVAAALAFGLKLLIGRPRPQLGEPDLILGPLGMYPLGPERGVIHAWEFWRDGADRLWSMPSSHTTYAVVAATVLAAWYPRLRWLLFALAALVALSRVAFGAHYPSDVAAGAAVGMAAAGMALHWRLGEPRTDPYGSG